MTGNKMQVLTVAVNRPATGSYGGSPEDQAASSLATLVVGEAFKRAGIDPQFGEQWVIGNC